MNTRLISEAYKLVLESKSRKLVRKYVYYINGVKRVGGYSLRVNSDNIEIVEVMSQLDQKTLERDRGSGIIAASMIAAINLGAKRDISNIMIDIISSRSQKAAQKVMLKPITLKMGKNIIPIRKINRKKLI